MADAVSGRQLIGAVGAVGLRGFSIFDMAGPDNSASGWLFQIGVQENLTDGDPASPCLQLSQPGVWRFRWGVSAGTHTAAVFCKQVIDATPYPSLVVRANASIGVASDVTGTAPAGAGWKTIGPITVTPSSPGVLMVELRNNYTGNPFSLVTGPWEPCLFDHLVLT